MKRTEKNGIECFEAEPGDVCRKPRTWSEYVDGMDPEMFRATVPPHVQAETERIRDIPHDKPLNLKPDLKVWTHTDVRDECCCTSSSGVSQDFTSGRRTCHECGRAVRKVRENHRPLVIDPDAIRASMYLAGLPPQWMGHGDAYSPLRKKEPTTTKFAMLFKKQGETDE